MSVDVVTFGCRLNAYESEVIRRNADAAGLTTRPRRRRGQHLRGDRRGGAAGAPDDPQARARAAGRAHRRHRLRGADRARDLSPPCPRSIACSAMPRRWTPTPGGRRHALAPSSDRGRRSEKIAVNDIMAVQGDRAASGRRLRRPRPRLRAGAERLRPPLHLLHHSVSAAAIRARCRWARWWRRCAVSSSTAIARWC